MLSSGSGGQPRSAGRQVQAGCSLQSDSTGLRCRWFAPLFALLVSGCSSFPSSMNPVSWWHDLQGGKIAEERPPPPGADQPYPNLATVPPKPAQPDRAALANIAKALVADRTNAQHAAAAAPIADPSLPSASPGLFGRGTVPPPPPPPPPGTQQAAATMAAAEAPPAPATPPPSPAPALAPATPSPPPTSGAEAVAPPAKAPVGAVQSAPLAPPGSAAQPPAEAAAPPPPLPTAPPPPPNLSNTASGEPSPPPAAASPSSPAPVAAPAPAPSPAPATVAAATPPPPPNPANTISVTFVNGSAALPPDAAETLKQFAARRGGGVIAVTGYGDAASNDPAAQSAALTLGLSRAQAIAAALTSAGVPSSAVQVDATAIGRGATARLVQ